MKQVNIAFQLLPFGSEIDSYSIIDMAIEMIEKSGITYKVCPFETVLEGDYDEIMKLIKKIHLHCIHTGVDSIISNLKIQIHSNKDVFIRDKISKYEKS